ncbi:MAG: hypothetical protein M3Z04_00915 [Chloroflexota bacterium]|nr:hypothetical protein [Chloroflexota bacterium]
MTLNLFLTASDVWLFRDGKSFDAGSDHRARTLFPPPPSVIQGALRSAYIARTTCSFDDYIHDRPTAAAIRHQIGPNGQGSYGNLALRGPFVATYNGSQVTRYYPLPADLVRQEQQGPNAACPWQRLRLRSLDPIVISPVRGHTNANQLRWPTTDSDDAEQPSDYWISEQALLAYLTNASVPQPTDLLHSNDLFARESRVGVGLNNQLRAAQESLLYEVEFARPQFDTGLMVSAEGLDGNGVTWGQGGALSLGGENRVAHYTTLAATATPPLAGPQLKGAFCLYLATPTYFDNGWQPTAGDWQRFFTGDTSSLTLQAAAIGRMVALGGIDLAASSRRGRGQGIIHKPARRFVPAGSVYYFKTDKPLTLKQGNSLCSGADWQIGFGQVLAGRWEDGNV